MPAFWSELSAVDSIDVDTRIAIVLEARKLVERATRWLVVNRRPPFDIGQTVESLRAGVEAVRAGFPSLLAGRDLAAFCERRESFLARGVPAGLAGQVAGMVPSYSACDIVQSAARTGSKVEETAPVYFALADRLQLGRLRDLIVALPRDDRWSSMARSALRDDLYAAHAALTRDVLATGTRSGEGRGPDDVARLAAWEERNAAMIGRAVQTLGEIWQSDQFSFTTMSVASRVIRTLVTSTTAPSGSPQVP